MHSRYTIVFLLYRSHVYDSVEMHSQKIKISSTTDSEYPLVSSSSKTPSTAKSSQDVKADAVKLQDNPSYVATNEFSWHAPLAILQLANRSATYACTGYI